MKINTTESILISIHPTHVRNILNGIKKFELRKKIPNHIKRIVIYATAPESRIVGIADVANIIINSPDLIWEQVSEAAGVDMEFFQDYFEGRDIGYAIEIGQIHQLDEPIALSNPRLDLSPPQSFCYLKNDIVNWLLSCANKLDLQPS